LITKTGKLTRMRVCKNGKDVLMCIKKDRGIGDNGAKHIADALMSNSSLTKLELRGAPPSSLALLPSLLPPAHPTPIAGAHSRPHLFLLF
jgi:hypothetical protein